MAHENSVLDLSRCNEHKGGSVWWKFTPKKSRKDISSSKYTKTQKLFWVINAATLQTMHAWRVEPPRDGRLCVEGAPAETGSFARSLAVDPNRPALPLRGVCHLSAAFLSTRASSVKERRRLSRKGIFVVVVFNEESSFHYFFIVNFHYLLASLVKSSATR